MLILIMFYKIFDLIKNPENIYVLLVILFFLVILLIIQTMRLHRFNSSVRKDAIKRSRAVIGGQVVEQIAPFLPNFPCSPADAKFIGKPIDFIAFSGLTEKDKVDEVLLIEVKTGQSTLSGREKEIKRAVKEGRVRYVEYRLN